MPEYLFHDAGSGRGADDRRALDLSDPKFLQDLSGAQRPPARHGRQASCSRSPNAGLAERLYRMKAKTLIVWGDSDRMIPPVYGPAFKSAIAGSSWSSCPKPATWSSPKADRGGWRDQAAGLMPCSISIFEISARISRHGRA